MFVGKYESIIIVFSNHFVTNYLYLRSLWGEEKLNKIKPKINKQNKIINSQQKDLTDRLWASLHAELCHIVSKQRE